MIERFAKQVKQHSCPQITSGWGRGHQLKWTGSQRPRRKNGVNFFRYALMAIAAIRTGQPPPLTDSS